MTTATLLAAGTTAVTSSDFTVAAGQPVRVAMTVTSTTARMTVHSVVLGVESLYAALSQSDPGITISAPGTYRVKRPVLTVASGVEVSTLVENNLEAEVGALTGATGGVVDPVGGVIYLDRCLKNFTGANQLTGGTVNTKTLLMQVSLPNGLLLDYRTSLRISAIFGFSLNTNNKSFGIDIGTTFAGATNLWTRSRTSATSGADSALLNLQRSPTLPTDVLLSYGGSVPYEGATNVNTAVYTFPYPVDPATAGLSLYFWGTLVTANTDQITLARALVESVTGEQ